MELNENVLVKQKLIEIADSIFNSDDSKQTKLLRLWAIIQLDYRGFAGEYANKYFLQLVDQDTSNFIFQLTGMLGNGFLSLSDLVNIITNHTSDDQAELNEAILKFETDLKEVTTNGIN